MLNECSPQYYWVIGPIATSDDSVDCSRSWDEMYVASAVARQQHGVPSSAGLRPWQGNARVEAASLPPDWHGGVNVARTAGAVSSGPPIFAVVGTGPCTVTAGGRCVGRAGGYENAERCDIVVSGRGGKLAECAVFDTEANHDYVSLQQSNHDSQHFGMDCPEGRFLSSGDTVAWYSDYSKTGSGWQICFEE